MLLISCLSVQGEDEEADWDLELLNEEDDGVVHWVRTYLPKLQFSDRDLDSEEIRNEIMHNSQNLLQPPACTLLMAFSTSI